MKIIFPTHPVHGAHFVSLPNPKTCYSIKPTSISLSLSSSSKVPPNFPHQKSKVQSALHTFDPQLPCNGALCPQFSSR